MPYRTKPHYYGSIIFVDKCIFTMVIHGLGTKNFRSVE